MAEFILTGPRGDNPLGFLVTLGALATLKDAGYSVRLAWQQTSPKLLVSQSATTTVPAIASREELVQALHRTLRRSPGEAAVKKVEQAKKEMEQAKTELKRKEKEIKSRKLDSAAARLAHQCELEPLRREVEERTHRFKELLARDAADPSVTLGKNLKEPNGELLHHVRTACDQATLWNRRWVDLAASYGIADPSHPDDRMLASPWALVSGSGHQDFLSTVQALMVECTAEHLECALFGPWNPKDEKYSLRLDPRDDRRYALMEGDPTASERKPRTLWGANRLAFEALRFFPCVPVASGMSVLAWQAGSSAWQDGCRVRWPLWDAPISADVVRSLLGLRDIWLDSDPAARLRLRGLGIRAVLESRRIAVGDGANKKYNVTPAAPVWIDAAPVLG